LDIKRTPELYEEVDKKKDDSYEVRELEQTIFVAYAVNEEWQMNGVTVSLNVKLVTDRERIRKTSIGTAEIPAKVGTGICLI